MELALHGADLGTWDWNIQTGEVQFNERWAEINGYDLNEIEPHLSTWDKLVHPEDLSGAYDLLNADYLLLTESALKTVEEVFAK